jgi:hypothetical protein
MGMHETIVSRNNAFLVAIGIVAGGKKKGMTDLGRALARALEHQMPDEITRHWQMVLENVPFFRNLLAAVRIRRGMDLPTLQAHVAYSAGQKKSPGVMAGAAAIVEIMKAAGVIQEDGGKYIAAEDKLGSTVAVEPGGIGLQGLAPNVVITRAPSPTSFDSSVLPLAGTGVSVQLQIKIHCTPAELDTLGEKLRTLIHQVSGASSPDKE